MQSQQQEQTLGQPQNVITRTRQDLINTGELFKMTGKVDVQQDTRSSPANTKASPDSNCKILLRDCCFLFANLALVVATVIAISILIRFFQDQPLADYYEYLLTFRFYWQLIFVICLMPFILLVPILAALQKLLSSRGKLKSSSSSQRLVLKARLLYQVLIWLLALLALAFLAPFIRSTTLQSQIKLELEKFMRQRYESEFAYRLLDDIQEHYECCDHLWYRANLRDQLPLSCFVARTNFSIYFDRTCSETLSSIVGLRCYLLAGCLVVILIAVAYLSFIDLDRLFAGANSGGRRHYEMGNTPAGLGTTAVTAIKAAMTSDEFDRLASSGHSLDGAKNPSSRYGPDEHEGDRPLLEDRLQTPASKERFSSLGVFDSFSRDAPDAKLGASSEPVVLTRANYQNVRRERSQSPMFLTTDNQALGSGEAIDRKTRSSDERQNSTGSIEPSRPIKSALKKTTSNSSSTAIDQLDGPNPPTKFGSLDDDDDRGFERGRQTPLGHFVDDYDDEEDDNDYKDRLRSQSDTLLRQKQLQRDQTRRSLLSVRFADEPDT